MAKKCIECGTVIADEKKFCTECGAPMADAPECDEPVSAPKVEATVGAPPPKQTPQPKAQPQEQPKAQPKAQPQYQQAQPQYQQPFYQAPPQPAYAPQPAYGDIPPAKDSKYAPISALGYIGIFLLMCIPILGLVLMIVWAVGGCKKINKRNMARGMLVMTIIGIILSIILGATAKSLAKKLINSVEENVGVSISGDKDDKDDNGGLLGGLAGLIGGGESGNSELDALKDLEGILGALGEDGAENDLGGAIDAIEDINKDAESKADGWPKSLRKYPGGTSKSVASYRTEISGTTAEEMMEWIDELKKDGFEYQDFYEFGLSESDMLSMNGWWATDGELYISLSYSDGTVLVDHMTELPDMSGLLGD